MPPKQIHSAGVSFSGQTGTYVTLLPCSRVPFEAEGRELADTYI